MNRRSRLETYIAILKAIHSGANKPTHIMYKANLAWTRMLKYLDFLVCQGLIEECVEEEGKRYYITRKGIMVLNYFEKILEALEVETAV